jgi:hypothetical protein
MAFRRTGVWRVGGGIPRVPSVGGALDGVREDDEPGLAGFALNEPD